MSSLENYPLVKFLKVILNGLWYLSIFVAALFTLAAVYAVLTDSDPLFTGGRLSLPVTFNHYVLPVQSLNPDFDAIEVELKSGDISFRPNATAFTYYVIFAGVMGFVVYLFILYQIKTVVSNLAVKHPFDKENIGRIRNIGFTYIGASVLIQFVYTIISYMVRDSFAVPNANISAGFSVNFVPIVSGMLILLIAEIFRLGVEMREEQKLTV